MSAESVRTRDLLRHRQLRLLLIADLVDGLGSWAFATVFSLVVYDRTHSISAITFALACRWVPTLLLGPFAGVLADRYDRSRLMIASATGSTVVMGALAGGVAVDLPLAGLLVLSGLQALIASAYNPAFAASLPDVLPERLLAGANGLREITINIAIVIGPAVGTVLLLVGDPALGIAFNALTFLIPIGVLLRLRITSRGAGEPGGNPFAELRDGVSALLAQRTAVVLFVAISVDSAVATVTTALALPISRYVGTGSQNYGYLLIASSLGSVAAAGLAGRLAAGTRLAKVIVIAMLAEAVPLALIVAVPHAVPVAALLFVAGAGMIVVDLVTVTALQRDIPREFRGRVFGLLDTTLLAFIVVFTVLGGALASWAGLATTLLVIGVGVPLLVLAALPALLETDRRTAARTAALEPVVGLLRKLDLFDGADQPTLERLAAVALPQSVTRGHTLITQGDIAEHLWLLETGELSVETHDAGALPTVIAPAYVGEIGVLHERARTATVRAATDCELYCISAADFRDAITGSTASPSLLLVTGQRLARTDHRPLVTAQ